MERKINSCLKNNFYHLFHSANIWVLTGYLLIWSDIAAKGIRTFCRAVDEKVTCFLFPLHMDSSYFSMLFLLGVFVLFLDCPFLNKVSDYEIPRMGKRIWLTGQFAYLAGASVFYVAAANLICNLLLLPYLTLKMEWGRVFYTLLRTSARKEFDVTLFCDASVLSRFSPVRGWCLQTIITIGVCFTMGSLLFTISLWMGRKMAVIIIGMLILYPIILETGTNSKLYFFSIISWVQLGRINDGWNGMLPSPTYIVGMLIFINAILYLINWVKIPALEWRGIRDERDNA
ncbi:MAG: hypothetical protein ACI4DX_05895 [Oliverpabstia sp.]